ncbi:MAG: Uma2 family endonuclease [Rivularia sp. (in: cyanobacteria)]
MYQTDPPRPPKEVLPTMYNLPSEDSEEPGLPDEFHDFQPQLLRETFQPANCKPDEVFVGSDLNLYYDPRHSLWYKRPDWFAVLGASRFYQQKELRLNYTDELQIFPGLTQRRFFIATGTQCREAYVR